MLPAILEIVRLALEITLQVIKDMPADQKAAAWAQHQQRMDFWQGLADRFAKG